MKINDITTIKYDIIKSYREIYKFDADMNNEYFCNQFSDNILNLFPGNIIGK